MKLKQVKKESDLFMSQLNKLYRQETPNNVGGRKSML